jgi:hypothetical protein
LVEKANCHFLPPGIGHHQEPGVSPSLTTLAKINTSHWIDYVNPGQIYPLFIFHVEKFRSFRIYMLQLQLESDKERVEVYTPKEAHKNLPQW